MQEWRMQSRNVVFHQSTVESRYEKEYTPLRKEDIDSEPPPPLPPQDAYLQGRLQRFYAELAQYAPGVSRAAYEERLITLGDGLLPPAPDPCAPLMHYPHACTHLSFVTQGRRLLTSDTNTIVMLCLVPKLRTICSVLQFD